MEKKLKAYYTQLTAELHTLYTEEAFKDNQVLSIVSEQINCMVPQAITYHIPEIDKLETIPARLLRFEGSELIDEEHYFFFFTVEPDLNYNRLQAAKRVLRATVALVQLHGYTRLLIQHVEAIPEKCFLREHNAQLNLQRSMAS
ncbi:hypothetical protein WG947_09685 [Pontibacter sp. H259]|uniref:hypothetical protein n=1 Tax=Pontibacter sp. H259 TaxID=3133421 RepID=UPI0030BD4A39